MVDRCQHCQLITTCSRANAGTAVIGRCDLQRSEQPPQKKGTYSESPALRRPVASQTQAFSLLRACFCIYWIYVARLRGRIMPWVAICGELPQAAVGTDLSTGLRLTMSSNAREQNCWTQWLPRPGLAAQSTRSEVVVVK